MMKPDILNVVRIYWKKWPKLDQCQDIVRFVSNMSGQSQDTWVGCLFLVSLEQVMSGRDLEIVLSG